MTTATISRYLNGLRTPTVENIILLAEAFKVSVDYLLGLHDVPDDKILTAAYSTASSADKRMIWTWTLPARVALIPDRQSWIE